MFSSEGLYVKSTANSVEKFPYKIKGTLWGFFYKWAGVFRKYPSSR